MAQKSPGARADKHPAKARQRAMGKPMRQRPEQTRAKPGQVERAVKDISGNRGRNGGTVERVRIVCASDCEPCPGCGGPFCVVCQQHYADCACVGTGNADELGYDVIEENGNLYGVKK